MDARLSIDISNCRPVAATASWTDEVIRTHGRLVSRLAWKVHRQFGPTTSIEDLVQVGNVALIEAARKFVDRGVATFSTYATIRIQGAMIDDLRKNATVSRSGLRQRRAFNKARTELSSVLGRDPTVPEMAENVNMAVGAYNAAVDAMRGIDFSSLDDEYSDSNIRFADPAPEADRIYDEKQRSGALAKAIAKLSEREQLVLQLFYVEECSLTGIGAIFNTSSPAICRIKSVAIAKLRTLLGSFAEC